MRIFKYTLPMLYGFLLVRTDMEPTTVEPWLWLIAIVIFGYLYDSAMAKYPD